MSTIDLAIILGVFLFVLLGIRDGFLKKLFGILGVLGGLVLATKFMGVTSDYLSDWLALPKDTSLVIAFFCIFLFCIIMVNLFYRWFGRTGSDTLKFWSRIAGGVLGAVQGVLAVSLVLLFFDVFDMPSEEAKTQSMLYQQSFHAAPRVFDYTTRWMPSSKKFFEEMRDRIEKYRPHVH